VRVNLKRTRYSDDWEYLNPSLKRLRKAVEGISKGTYSVQAVSPTNWQVRSDKNTYKVSFQNGTFHCTCKDWQYRNDRVVFCKHTWVVIATQELPDEFTSIIIANPELTNYVEVKT